MNNKYAGSTGSAFGILPGIIGIIGFKNKRAPETTFFTAVDLSDVPSCHRIDITTPANRTANHLNKYMFAYSKKLIGLNEKSGSLARGICADSLVRVK
jgi:hypothetical protein